MAIVPLALITLFRGLKRDDARHKKIARITWPIWFYVSVTGVLVYFMLYVWFPAPSTLEKRRAESNRLGQHRLAISAVRTAFADALGAKK